MTNLLRNIHYHYYMNGRVIEYNMPCFISHMTLGLLVLFQGIVRMCASFTQKLRSLEGHNQICFT
jgi:hypothetical protein